jgi:hypothetical protein
MSHITIAASARAFNQLFNAVRNNFRFSSSDSKDFGPFSSSYSIAIHLDGGTVTLNDDNTIEISDMDIYWDTLELRLCFNLPGFCTPSFCIIPDPWNGCLVGIPSICVGGPICVPLILSGLVSEISDVKASLITKYFVDPARTSAESDLDAELAGHPNKWQIFLDPIWVLVSPVDIPDTVANLLEQAVKDAIENMLPSWLPGWVTDLIWAFFGPILDLVKSILEIAGDISEWISNLLNNMLGIVGVIETTVADYFANQYPIYQFEDPYPILPGEPGLIPVKIPIRDLTVKINSKEMIIESNVG